MLDWVTRQAQGALGWFTGAASNLWNEIVSFVWGVVHGVIGWLEGLFGIVSAAWGYFEEAIDFVAHYIEQFAGAAAHFISDLVNHVLPSLWRWIEHAVSSVWHSVKEVVKWAAGRIAHAVNLAEHLVSAAMKWVLQHVWHPLMGFVQDIYSKLRKWALAAWQLLTHPIKLAEIIFWPLWYVFEQLAPKVARRIGKWVAELVLHSLIKMVGVVEDILAAVF